MKLAFCSLLILSVTCPAFAWHTNTHLQMTRDAIALLPADFQKTFKDHLKYVESGIKDPDELLKDWQNHYYIPSNPPQGSGLARIEKLIDIVQMKFKSGNELDSGRQLCYLAHYIGDLWIPEDSINKQSANDPDFMTNNEIMVFWDGYQKPIENYHDYFQKRSEWRWRLENSKQISTLLYNEAVNDIARTWLSIWQQSGKKVEPLHPSLIVHKKGALNINFERLLVEEYVHWYAWRSEDDPVERYSAHYKEMNRLSENVLPNDAAIQARIDERNEQARLSGLNPEAPFQMLETSLKTIGDKAYFLARVYNKSQQEIPSIAFMYPGVRGPAATVKNLKPGEIYKAEASLPAGATKDQIQLIFASSQ